MRVSPIKLWTSFPWNYLSKVRTAPNRRWHSLCCWWFSRSMPNWLKNFEVSTTYWTTDAFSALLTAWLVLKLITCWTHLNAEIYFEAAISLLAFCSSAWISVLAMILLSASSWLFSSIWPRAPVLCYDLLSRPTVVWDCFSILYYSVLNCGRAWISTFSWYSILNNLFEILKFNNVLSIHN